MKTTSSSERPGQRFISEGTDDLKDLDFLRDAGSGTLETKLLRISTFLQLKRKWETQNMGLKLAQEDDESKDGGEVEAIYFKLIELNLSEAAKSFLFEKSGSFPEDWRLRYLFGTVLARIDH
jgi:hypothetical protein